ncbi:MAG: flagellar hook-basal body complex protein [Planctomycetota bacterium]|jgi:flagellar basal-body rod protein FlgG|nr:flagellar hook-basal body complex protein [Planctomycetota bacterium]
MINGMYLSTMGATCEMARHETVSNNLANANTDGFKPNFSIFRDVPAESVIKGDGRREIDVILEKTGGGAWMDRTTTDFTPGPVVTTDNPLNMAINDKDRSRVSFFMVRPRDAADDDVRYTRNGTFMRAEDGMLVTTDGDLVLDGGGGPIQLTGSQGFYKVGDNGVVTVTNDFVDNAVLGQVGLASITKEEAHFALRQLGNNQYVPDKTINYELTFDTVNRTADTKSGLLEQSATNPVYEMVDMINAHRSFELNMRFITMQDQTLGQALSRLTARAG